VERRIHGDFFFVWQTGKQLESSWSSFHGVGAAASVLSFVATAHNVDKLDQTVSRSTCCCTSTRISSSSGSSSWEMGTAPGKCRNSIDAHGGDAHQHSAVAGSTQRGSFQHLSGEDPTEHRRGLVGAFRDLLAGFQRRASAHHLHGHLVQLGPVFGGRNSGPNWRQPRRQQRPCGTQFLLLPLSFVVFVFCLPLSGYLSGCFFFNNPRVCYFPGNPIQTALFTDTNIKISEGFRTGHPQKQIASYA